MKIKIIEKKIKKIEIFDRYIRILIDTNFS